MEVKILWTASCHNCSILEMLVKTVVSELELEASVEKITDIEEVMSYNIMSTPGLVINEKLVLYWKVPSKEELVEIFNTHK